MSKKFVPYTIKHLQLEMLTVEGLPLSPETGHYLVFWWKDYPLGDLYLSPGTNKSSEELLAEIIKRIQPTLYQYIDRDCEPVLQRLPSCNSITDLQYRLRQIFTHSGNNHSGAVELSVIVCTRNRSQFIGKCIESLLSLQVQPKEIVIVDNAPSDDRTRDVVATYKGVIYTVEPRPGLDFARNKGIRSATCPLVAFVDDDVKVHKLWAWQVARSFDNPAIAAMTGLVFASQLNSEAQLLFERFWSFNRGFVKKLYDPSFLNGKGKTPPDVCEIGAGANMAFRRSVFIDAGMFDERLDAGAAGCNGDSEMWFRVLLNGNSILYNPLAIVHHEHRHDLTGLKKQIFNYMRGFTVASLIQHKQNSRVGYLQHVTKQLPYHYLQLVKRGFPFYRFRYSTLFQEIAGMLSGFLYYRKIRKR